jgi:hypothetical protein
MNAGNGEHGAERAGNKSDGFQSESRMIDGEVVVPATNGTSDFSVLQENAPGAERHPTQATNLMTMKIPKAVAAVSIQDVPTRAAI